MLLFNQYVTCYFLKFMVLFDQYVTCYFLIIILFFLSHILNPIVVTSDRALEITSFQKRVLRWAYW